jgi:pimeloyl-ACP methyl ester carboxylesterase
VSCWFFIFLSSYTSKYRFNHFTAVIEGQTVHFIHERSADTDAIPVILVHGWPGIILLSISVIKLTGYLRAGSFQEFLPVIKPLTQSWTSPTGKKLSYNVVVPSLPGFVFSSAPPLDWTVNDTARIFNTLMTDVLGYSTYAVHSTDWVRLFLSRFPSNTHRRIF